MARGLKVPSASPTDDQVGDQEEVEAGAEVEVLDEELPSAARVEVTPAKTASSPGTKMVRVKPRVNRESFRCNGRFWTCVAGKEMTVPEGVAEHMQSIGIL